MVDTKNCIHALFNMLLSQYIMSYMNLKFPGTFRWLLFFVIQVTNSSRKPSIAITIGFQRGTNL